jgi:hypothetical protein
MNLNNLQRPQSADVQLAEVKTRLFSESWLNEPDAEGDFPRTAIASPLKNSRNGKIRRASHARLCPASDRCGLASQERGTTEGAG